jgi:membrane protease YdiL (CAAX protease family)
MAIVDHLMILVLFVAQPVHGSVAYRRYLARIEAGQPPDRRGQYRDVLVLEWVSFAVLLAVWLAYRRPFADLGFVAPGGWGFWAGALLLTVATALLTYAWRSARHATDDERRKAVASVGNLVYLAPNTSSSYRLFCGVSVTAGIVEETIYRGFVFWYLAPMMPMWAVVLVSAAAFGLGHSYQGVNGMLRVTAVGTAFGLLYWLCGSIWLPILAHMLLDILQGATLLEMLRHGDEAPAEPVRTPVHQLR